MKLTNVENCQYGHHCNLPYTGANLTTILAVVAAMLLVGAVLFVASRHA